jgi:hypothetical protein
LKTRHRLSPTMSVALAGRKTSPRPLKSLCLHRAMRLRHLLILVNLTLDNDHHCSCFAHQQFAILHRAHSRLLKGIRCQQHLSIAWD